MFFAVFPLLSRALMCCSRQPKTECQHAGDKGQGWQGTRQPAGPQTGSNPSETPMQGALEGKGPEEPRKNWKWDGIIDPRVLEVSQLSNTSIRHSRRWGACDGKLSRGTGETGLCKTGGCKPNPLVRNLITLRFFFQPLSSVWVNLPKSGVICVC